jgi:putative transport protein
MNWLAELFARGDAAHGHVAVAQTILIISLVAATGHFLGSFKVRGVGLGVAGVLFSGLLFGHFGFKVDANVMQFVREFGLILFVYTIGMQVGPGFVASLRRQGLPLNLMAAAIVLLGVAVTLGVVYVLGIDMTVAVGLFSGGTTNTPALGAAQQALQNIPAEALQGVARAIPDLSGLSADAAKEAILKRPGLGYAVAYPFGILGIILVMGLVRAVFRIKASDESAHFSKLMRASQSSVTTLNLIVQNSNLNGMKIEEVPGMKESGVVVSRIRKGSEIDNATPDTVLHVGDVILIVGATDKIRQMQIVIGAPTEMDLKALPSRLTTRRVVVTHKEVLGKTLDELNLHDLYDVTITRVSRAEIEFTPSPNFRVEFADTLLLVGEPEAIEKAARFLGNSPRQLNHPQIMPIFVGIALGVLLGSWPFTIGHMPAAVKLGLAGGPLLVAILLSRIGRLGPLIYYMPLSANFMLREVGITLFLACVGLKAGDQFMATLTNGPGLYWMACAALITLLPLLIVGFIARLVYKQNYMTLCGVLAGSMTDPPALAFANSIAASDAPSISYATVYPLTMLLRVVCAQLLVLFFVT